LKFEKFFKRYGCEVCFLPNGVDTNRFTPASTEKKLKIREKYGVSAKKFVILHVGHIKRARNLEVLGELQKRNSDAQVIVVGGTSMPMDTEVRDFLEKAGCIVWRRYFDNVQEIYWMADCFLFPTRDLEAGKLPNKYNQIGSIDLPLSVLEAMACNLPVLSTRFGALPRLFEPGGGLFYFEDNEDLFRSLMLIKHGLEIRTRERVMMLDWDRIVLYLEREYMRVCGLS
jgi:glycosyltransferase involved in cell wall biosynthesis